VTDNIQGIRFEWQTADGQWKSCWIQTAIEQFQKVQFPEDVTDAFSAEANEAYEYVSTLYRKVLCIYDTVRQVEYTDEGELFSWIKIGPMILALSPRERWPNGSHVLQQ
jgi:hypothetical protein